MLGLMARLRDSGAYDAQIERPKKRATVARLMRAACLTPVTSERVSATIQHIFAPLLLVLGRAELLRGPRGRTWLLPFEESRFVVHGELGVKQVGRHTRCSLCQSRYRVALAGAIV